MCDKGQTICKYNQTGSSKHRNNCHKKHVYDICTESGCTGRYSNKRHPKECTQFNSTKNGRFNEKCVYKHSEITNIVSQDETIKLILGMITKHDNSINLIVEELLSKKSKIVKDDLESAIKVLSQEIKFLQVENKNIIQKLSQLEKELKTKDESEKVMIRMTSLLTIQKMPLR